MLIAVNVHVDSGCCDNSHSTRLGRHPGEATGQLFWHIGGTLNGIVFQSGELVTPGEAGPVQQKTAVGGDVWVDHQFRLLLISDDFHQPTARQICAKSGVCLEPLYPLFATSPANTSPRVCPASVVAGLWPVAVHRFCHPPVAVAL